MLVVQFEAKQQDVALVVQFEAKQQDGAEYVQFEAKRQVFYVMMLRFQNSLNMSLNF